MLERVLYEQYRLHCDKRMKIGKYDGFQASGKTYIIAPFKRIEGTDMSELMAFITLYYKQGDTAVAPIERTVQGNFYFVTENGYYTVLRIPDNRTNFDTVNVGRELALFHKRTSGYPFKKSSLNYYLSWKVFWQRRMEQMEAWYEKMKQSKEKTDTDRLFIETFPYFLGLTENALQYVSEIERDEGENLPTASVCHEQFLSSSWDCDGYYVKLPTRWIVDQPSRDIAEYLRKDFYDDAGVKKNGLKFINDYEKILPLSKASWRFLYARLLFPVDYYRNVEGFYSARTNDNKIRYASLIEKTVNDMDCYERNLKTFYQSVGLPAEQLLIPTLDWMKS
jgi:spore coat protein YutH